jgi:hypothetical protein
MMRLLIAAALLSATTPALAETRDFHVTGFDRIVSAGPWDVRIHTGRGPSVHADGDRATIDKLKVEVVGGELRISAQSADWATGLFHARKLAIEIGVPTLTAVQDIGPGDVAVDRVRSPRFATRILGPGTITIAALDTQALAAELQGPGDLKIAGRAGKADVSLSGPGNLHGKDLRVGDVHVTLMGPGTIELTAFGNATGSLSGPGDINLGGKPRCTISKSGPGSIRCGG